MGLHFSRQMPDAADDEHLLEQVHLLLTVQLDSGKRRLGFGVSC